MLVVEAVDVPITRLGKIICNCIIMPQMPEMLGWKADSTDKSSKIIILSSEGIENNLTISKSILVESF